MIKVCESGKMRKIIVGDVHGCNKELVALLEKAGLSCDDQLILLGDLFDRGDESWDVFRTVQELAKKLGERFVLLRGNHEDYLLKEKLTLKEQRIWNHVGKGATVASFKAHGEKMEDARGWIREHCQMFYRDGEFQCVHAGLLMDPIEVNDNETMIHDHGIAMRNVYGGPLTVVGHIALEQPTWFAGDGETTEELPYDEVRELPGKGVICIDTGSGKGGWLSAMVVEGKRYKLIRV